MDELTIGKYTASVIEAAVLAFIFYLFPEGTLSDRAKALIAVLAGVALGLVAIQYYGAAWDFKTVWQNALDGLFVGLAAIGVYKAQQKLRE
jgi:membrane associated rhomboid family serine protease